MRNNAAVTRDTTVRVSLGYGKSAISTETDVVVRTNADLFQSNLRFIVLPWRVYVRNGVEFMSIKPVDLQVMLPKMSEVIKSQGTDTERQLQASQRGEIDARYMVDADLKEVHTKKNAQKVVSRDKKEDEERKKKKNSQQGRSGDGKNQANKNLTDGDPARSQFIDIKL